MLRQPQVDLGLAAAGHAVQERGAELTRIGERRQLIEGRTLLGRELTGRVEGLTAHRGTFEGIAFLGLGPESHQPFSGQSGQHVRRHAAVAELTERKTDAGRRRENLERLPLLWGQSWGQSRTLTLGLTPLEAMGRNGRDPAGSERRCPGASARGQCHRNRIADSGEVILRHPRAQVHDTRRQKRLAIDDLDDVLDRVGRGNVRVELDDTTGQGTRADRHTNPGPDGWQLEVIRNAVREAIEKRDRDRY